MSRGFPERIELMGALGQQLGRRFSTAVVMFHQAIADKFGVNATDFKCGDLLSRKGPMTAGELAKLTGMDTGTITTVIDRLEKAGFARRTRDPHDRRKVIVEPIPERQPEIDEIFASMSEAISDLTADYTDQEIERILSFMDGAIDIIEAETITLRKQSARARKPRSEGSDEG